MTAKPVAAGGAGPAVALEVAAAAASSASSAASAGKAAAAGKGAHAGKAAAAGKAQAGKPAGASGAARAKGAAPGGASGSATLGKSVEKALGKKPAGSAPGAAPAGKTSTGASAAGGYASAEKATGEWAFLQDKGLSIEDKLFRFLMEVQKKNHAELVKKMEEYRARFTSSGSSSSSSGTRGSSLFDALKSAVPFVGAVADLIGEAGVKKLVGQLSGPVLAALATAAGAPYLAPAALQWGGDLAGLAFVDVGGKAASGSSASGSARTGESPDERVAMFELQRLAEKQQAMFTAISNTLKCMHDTQMAAIHNIR